MLSVAILAAGKGTRMESSLPKVLHKISGKSLLQRVINSCTELKPDQIFVITGHKSKEVQKSIPNDKKFHVVVQEPQSGTCLLYTSPSPRDRTRSRMPSSA